MLDKALIPSPTKVQVLYWLEKWNELEDYSIQEEAIDELFAGSYKSNKELKNIMIKCSILNDFYSTNIFKIYPVACRILELDIDERLANGDITLVNDIATVTINEKKKTFHTYSMRQAIEEGFILDVLSTYVTIKEVFKLITNTEDNPELLEEKAKRALFKHYKQHEFTISQKVDMIMDNFLNNGRKKINGHGKAMIVTDSRQSAVYIIKQLKSIYRSIQMKQKDVVF